ncbi:MAG: porin [Solirubrobacteraceae bacterium]
MKITKKILVSTFLVLFQTIMFGQSTDGVEENGSSDKPYTLQELTIKIKELEAEREKVNDKVFPTKKNWFESMNIGGYLQMRYNGLLQSNDALLDPSDNSVGGVRDFSFRRGRVKFSGDVNKKRVGYYIQLDYANVGHAGAGVGSGVTSSGSNPVGSITQTQSTNYNWVELRDAYVDLSLDTKTDNDGNALGEYKLRFGLTKVPFGFDNLQSSQNRLAFERSLAINSAAPGERDMGIFFHWAPQGVRKLFKSLVDEGFKGSGDYGVFNIGVYNGQAANTPEAGSRGSIFSSNALRLDSDKHVAARISYPFVIGEQILEIGASAYTGYYQLLSQPSVDFINNQVIPANSDLSIQERRFAPAIILYPKPFGLQAEYTWGKGPAFNTFIDSSNALKSNISSKDLQGGYVTASYLKIFENGMKIQPYTRYQYFDGGRKNSGVADYYTLHEIEGGIEFTPWKAFELTVAFTNRNQQVYNLNSLKPITALNPSNDQSGNMIRVQAQLNF